MFRTGGHHAFEILLSRGVVVEYLSCFLSRRPGIRRYQQPLRTVPPSVRRDRLRALRDTLVKEGDTGVHHLLDESGWTTFYIEHPDDYDHARWLVRLSYLYHVSILKETPAGAEEYESIDVQKELERLALSDSITAAFERRCRGSWVTRISPFRTADSC